MRVQDVMSKDPTACGPTTNLAAAAEVMWTHDCGSVPVLDDAGAVIGIATDRDMFIALGTRNQRPADLTVRDVMTSPAVTCRPTDDVESALSAMKKRQIRRLPVVDSNGELVGVLAMNDIILHSDAKSSKETAVASDQLIPAFKAICEHTHVA